MTEKDESSTYSEDDWEMNPMETMETEPGTVEIEMTGDERDFVHKITSADEVIITGKDPSRWYRRKRFKVMVAVVSLIFICLVVSVNTQRRKRKDTTSSSMTANSPPNDTENTSSGNTNSDGPADNSSPENPAVNEGFEDEDVAALSFAPFSYLDPVLDLDLPNVARPEGSKPAARLAPLRASNPDQALPTNAWYQNLLLLHDDETPTGDHRAYTMPYIVDVVGAIPGMRVHRSTVEASADQVIVSVDEPAALTLGAAVDFTTAPEVDSSAEKGYTVLAVTDLGITLEWAYHGMQSSLVRGMPYATMIYPNFSSSAIVPTIYGESNTVSSLLLDGGTSTAACTEGSTFKAKTDIELRFETGLTWLVFFSHPAFFQCKENVTTGSFMLQAVDSPGLPEGGSFTVRLAMVFEGENSQTEEYKALLRSHSEVYPGKATAVGHEMGGDEAALIFDWDPQPMDRSRNPTTELIMFAMPHHQDKLAGAGDYCAAAMLGPVCVVKGSKWAISEQLPPISFAAPRLPEAAMVPDLMEAVTKDLLYRVPQNFFIGAGDTYFSGKALGKLSRILLIAEEMLHMCTRRRRSMVRSLASDTITEACGQSSLPSQLAMDEALDHLRSAVEVWINGDAQAPFLYDSDWGGLVNCGCDYASGTCQNVFPNCPGLSDQGLNFGAGFYNDHHFHYGYHIYAAAVVAHFDPEWGRDNFEKVLMFVRDIANPSLDDHFFPPVRHKDWYHGSSWASGISRPASPTGMNQESSSEAIAGYEAVALFGKTMSSIFSDGGDAGKAETADNIYKIGRLLVATELRSTQRYWQISHDQGTQSTFDAAYQHNVVGILWSSKAFFGTWFGNAPYLIYGIQLIPLTSISEERDSVAWAREAFDPYAQSCNQACIEEGWSVQILALLATLGLKEKALGHAKNLTDSVFETAGGNGHSMSNTIWYIATRPSVDEPYKLVQSYPWEVGQKDLTCFQPSTCTASALEAMAGEYDCRSRISYLINQQQKSEYDACYQIAVDEFPEACGLCKPDSLADVVDSVVEDVEDLISEFQPSLVPPADGITCNRPLTCTSDVLRAYAGEFICGDRIEWLMTNQGLSETAACKSVAVDEFPGVCGGCDPDGN